MPDEPDLREYVRERLAAADMLACPDPDCDACLLAEAEHIVDARRRGIPIDCEGPGGRLIARSDLVRFRASPECFLGALAAMATHETKVYPDEPDADAAPSSPAPAADVSEACGDPDPAPESAADLEAETPA